MPNLAARGLAYATDLHPTLQTACRNRGSAVGRLAVTNVVGAVAVAFTLAVNLARCYLLIAIAATVIVAAFLHWRWVRAGRPRGIEAIEREAEAEGPVENDLPVALPEHPGV